jgi:acetyltransferase-like isoleucine patch superfamily enzyme
VGAPIAAISAKNKRPRLDSNRDAKGEAYVTGDRIATKKAMALMEKHGLSLDLFSGIQVVKTRHVNDYLAMNKSDEDAGPPSTEGSEDLDEILSSPEFRSLKGIIEKLAQRMRLKFDRHVPPGALLVDRWELAKSLGFGEGTSVYAESLILGDVRVGKHCWIGPFSVLDGSGGTLTIGDYTSVGSGAQIYTHSTFEAPLTGNKARKIAKETEIGSCCFIAPTAIVALGSRIGDHCFVSAGAYVDGEFPAFCILAGNPAKQVGTVELAGDRARLKYF